MTNSAMLIVTMLPPKALPKRCWKARAGMLAACELGTDCQMPVTKTTKAVMVPIRNVSTIISKIPQKAWRTGWSVMAVAWAMGAVPIPASFSNMCLWQHPD